MYKKVVRASLGIFFSGLLITGCGDSASKGAEDLVSEASQALDNGNATLALELLDSLQKVYPEQIKQQREGLKLRPRAMELSIIEQIQTTDSLLASLAESNSNLGNKMKTISDARLVEPYQTPASGYNGDFINSTGIQARVDRAGQFYLVSSVNGGGLKHTSLTFTSGGDELMSAQVPLSSDLNYQINGSEIVTFMPEKCDTIGAFFVAHRDAPVNVRFNGEKGKSRQIKLSKAQVEGIADAYAYSQSVIRGRDLSVQREKLDRQLQIARDQQARLSTEE